MHHINFHLVLQFGEKQIKWKHFYVQDKQNCVRLAGAD